MDPETEWFVIAALWAAAVVWAAWNWVPYFLMCTVGTGYESGGTEDPAAIEPDGTDPDYASVFATLRSLGYEPLGPGFMRLWFAAWQWAMRTRVQAFASRSAGRFAFTLQYPFPLSGYTQVFFAACWADGRLLLTMSGPADDAVRTDDDVVEVKATDNVHELERYHREAADKLRSSGWRPDADLSLDNLLAVTRESHRRRRGLGLTEQRPLFRLLFGAWLAATAGSVWFLGWDAIPPLVSIGLLAVYRGLDLKGRIEFARAARSRAAADRAREPHTSTTGAT
ncbi:unnamed protein product [Gemmataceae bacterium]|nr:unnamed protein product [Gemmataceae bacterium]VTU02323.1 unnamed protein product [Gemmataceae bacterium]